MNKVMIIWQVLFLGLSYQAFAKAGDCRWRARIRVDNGWLPSFSNRIICGNRIFDKKRQESFQQVKGVFEKVNPNS